jgi:mRNA-degrading endonuclease toxin of MazEF toxin-antitoxin module
LIRGELYFANLPMGRKLVLVASWNEINERLGQPIIALVTANDRERSLETYVRIDPPEAGVWRPSFILCHALLTVEEWRLESEPLGALSRDSLSLVDAALAAAFDLPKP